MNGVAQFTPLVNAIVSNIHEGVILADNDGEVLYHNPAAADLLGLRTMRSLHDIDDVTGINVEARCLRHHPEPLGPDTHALIERPLRRFSQFEQDVTHHGVTRFIEFSTGMLAVPGEHLPLHLLLVSDVTERRRLEAVFKNNVNAGLITQDPNMLEVTGVIEQIAQTKASVLLQGESGTGKTLLARMIHHKSQRADQPLIEINCAAIPESLLESELFGHIKGAFTGAVSDRPGRMRAANQGTLFLDEISEIPLHLQPKLLKALEDQSFQMVGSDRSVNVDVRLIAASNQNLRELVDQGKFRADLYYRLAVIPIEVPPLRERPGDIPVLIHHICDQLVARGYPSGIQCNKSSMRMMLDYPWPGNVRELSNAVEHAMILAENQEVNPMCLPREIRKYSENLERMRNGGANQEDNLRVQRQEILDALMESDGNRAEAARVLGIDRSTLWRRMQRLGLI